MKILPFNLLFKNAFATFSLKPRDIVCCKINDCHFKNTNYPNCLLFFDEKCVEPYEEYHMSLQSNTSYPSRYLNISVEINEEISDKEYYFFIYNTSNYYHFIYDSLPYLWAYFYLGLDKLNIKLLVEKENLYPFVKETFELLGISYEVISSKKRYSTVYFSSSLTHGGKSNYPQNPEAKSIYERLIQSVKDYTSSINVGQKIYVSRRTHLHDSKSNLGTDYTQRRICKSEDKIVELLSKNGYIEVFPECWTMKDKIKIFNQVTHIAGLIGGGVSNSLFSNGSTETLVIVSPTFLDVNFRFQFCLNHTKVTYFTETFLLKFDNSELSPYIRVKNNETDEVGEIIKVVDENKIRVVVGTKGSTFVNSIGQEKEFLLCNCTFLDKGLNSPFDVVWNKFKVLFYQE
jgi:hypothetical protein